MTTSNQIVLKRAPAKMSPYFQAFLRRRGGPRRPVELPTFSLRQEGIRVDEEHLSEFLAICGLPPQPSLPLLYPLSLVFPYHMAIVAHRDFPLLYLKMLNLRVHVLGRKPILPSEELTIESAIVAQRIVAKGLEFDIHTQISTAGKSVWESVHSNFFPGRYGEAQEERSLAAFEAVTKDEHGQSWQSPPAGGWRFARLSGDYNGVHYVGAWARLFGFKSAFAHTARMLSDCLKRLPEPPQDKSVRLDAAFRGPVYYDTDLTMKAGGQYGATCFELFCGQEERPAIRGRLTEVGPDHEILKPLT